MPCVESSYQIDNVLIMCLKTKVLQKILKFQYYSENKFCWFTYTVTQHISHNHRNIYSFQDCTLATIKKHLISNIKRSWCVHKNIKNLQWQFIFSNLHPISKAVSGSKWPLRQASEWPKRPNYHDTVEQKMHVLTAGRRRHLLKNYDNHFPRRR